MEEQVEASTEDVGECNEKRDVHEGIRGWHEWHADDKDALDDADDEDDEAKSEQMTSDLSQDWFLETLESLLNMNDVQSVLSGALILENKRKTVLSLLRMSIQSASWSEVSRTDTTNCWLS